MIRYLLLFVIISLNPLAVLAEEATEDEIKPQIGSIDDPGRVDPDEYEFSNAENILWMDKHLSNIEQPARLHYEFEKTGSYEDGFTDDVYLTIVQVNEDGTRNTKLDFFTGEQKQIVAPSNVQKITGNPVIGIYLQGDVYEMSRLTEGSWKYFQRQIKLAIADSNTTEPVTVEFDGTQYKGEKIILFPYGNVSKKSRLKEFSDKRYEFIFSDSIPGKLYQIKTVMNDAENPDIPLIEETLTLANVDFSSKVIANKEK